MVFSSAIFLFGFLPITYIVYRLLPGLKAKNCFLALASVIFYAFGIPKYVPLFLSSVLINYLSGLAIMRLDGGGRKAILALSIAVNIALLAIYKYGDFAVQNLNSLFSLSLPLPGIALPIGISFFTFQGMSYVIDVYRQPESGTRSFVRLLLYISFFPQLIAGPIVKYHDIASQIDDRSFDAGQTAYGLRRFIRGLSKKLLIANAVGTVADAVFSAALPDSRLAWLGGICYTLQIYYDFSGYSDMAIGMGRMFGFTIKENFNFPYAAESMTEFWQRWHISLTTWFREYLYIPLGGNRRGKARMVLNRFIVFLCTGIWHGANWTFIIWGLCHGALTSLERLGLIPVDSLRKTPPGRLLARVYTLLSVMLLFVVFRADSLGQAWGMIAAMFSFGAIEEGSLLLAKLLTPAVLVALFAAILLSGKLIPVLRERSSGGAEPKASVELLLNAGSLALFLLCALCLSNGGFNPFIYFQF